MNRKKKINDLYKGVFKNDKKSCLIDLKPLEDKCTRKLNEPLQERKSVERLSNYPTISKEKKSTNKQEIEVNIKVAKNLGFGSFFQKLREDIVDIFLAKEDLISFEKMFTQKEVYDLFNIQNSTSKFNNSNDKNQNSFRGLSALTNDLTVCNYDAPYGKMDNEEEVILYEDEEKTIYKRKKTKSKNLQKSIFIPKIQNNLNYFPQY